MSAKTGPVRCRPVAIPGKLYATVIAPIDSIMWSVLGAACLWESVRGASEHAKSTVFVVSDWTPCPLPTDW